jgi:hypothetical protein
MYPLGGREGGSSENSQEDEGGREGLLNTLKKKWWGREGQRLQESPFFSHTLQFLITVFQI